MVYKHAVSFPETFHPGATLNYFTGRFMPGHYVLIPFRSYAQMLTINTADVRSADSRIFSGKQNLPMAGHWHCKWT
jgi:hypothetical protein